jgi:F420-dependent oxidoreductase-like protein
MRFAIKTSPENTTWSEILDIWTWADEIELFESAWNFDHFYPVYADATKPCLEAWVTASALAQATKRLRIGTLVSGAVYRHPAVLANMAATLDIVSGGRLELGLGTGWHEAECEAYGIELGPMGERFDRFEEALQVITGLLTDETTSFSGDYYTLTEARCEPKPIQRPYPPICIGGVGKKRTLRLVAQYAQHWNHMAATPEDLPELIDVLDGHCADVGRDRSEILISSHVFVMPDADPGAVAQQVADLGEAGLQMAIIYLQPPYDPATLDPLIDALTQTR